ncbi:MAG: TonB-dependent receptor [Bacteroidales bacterium]|jgi:hypothetical protein|nr:TonB-dependent receptor [Bacteroidales bacterium]
MKKLLFILFIFLLPLFAIGQVTLQGTIKDEQGVAISDAIITVLRNDGAILNFTYSDAQGRYSITRNSQDDSLHIRVSCLDYATQLITVTNRSQQLDFSLVQQATELTGVTIRPRDVWRNRDTVSYSVLSFANPSDRTIADVLRKMPGIEVQPSGRILYNNEPINRFYVEGMDLMGGRYNVISENLRHNAVETVQILENHEPIKALEDVSLSDRAALNIVLKEDAKATWQTAMKLGLGFPLWLWDCELTAMRFAKNVQDAIVYKTNNIGINASHQLTAHYGIAGFMQNNLLSIPVPSSGISENRSLFNNQHLITANRLIKLNDVYQIRLNADYLNDRQKTDHSSQTIYFLDGTEITIDEQTHAVLDINRANLTLTLTGNHKNYFLENALNLQGNWTSTFADISKSEQRLKTSTFRISDDFRWLRVIDKMRIDIESSNRLSNAPQSLTIKPGLFADFFNDSIPYEHLKQEADLLEFTSNSSINLSNVRGRWQTNYELGLDFRVQQLNSELSVPERITADTLRNEFRFMFAQPFVAARYSYVAKRLTATMNFPAGYAIQRNTDKLSTNSNTEGKPYINPSLSLRYRMGYQWELSSSARYSNNFSTIRNLYTGYLLNDYRNIRKNNGEFSSSNTQSYNLGLRYNEPLTAMNAGVFASYGRTRFDMLPEVNFDGILSIRELVEYKGYNDSKSIGLSFGKGFKKVITKADLHGSYTISTNHQLQQGMSILSEHKGYNISLAFFGKLSSLANYNYRISHNSGKTTVEGNVAQNFGAIRRTTQHFRLNVTPTKLLVLALNMDYSQSSTTSNLPSTFFTDLRVQYKFKHWELGVNWNNIFNANKYVVANYGEFLSYVNTFELRPSNIVFSVRFSL